MNKKILVTSILVVLILGIILSVYFIFSQNVKPSLCENDSPLFRITNTRSIGGKMESINVSYIDNQLFYLPFEFPSSSQGRILW